MHWNKKQVEEFFGASFISDDHVLYLQFEAGRLKYHVMLDENRRFVLINADPENPYSAFPAIELQFPCARIDLSEAGGVGPVLLFYLNEEKAVEHVRLCITRTKERTFSLSPHLR